MFVDEFTFKVYVQREIFIDYVRDFDPDFTGRFTSERKKKIGVRSTATAAEQKSAAEGRATSERAPDYSAYYDAMATFLLYESASGYALFEGLDMDEIGQTAEAVQATITCVETAAPFSFSGCRA